MRGLTAALSGLLEALRSGLRHLRAGLHRLIESVHDHTTRAWSRHTTRIGSDHGYRRTLSTAIAALARAVVAGGARRGG